MFTKVNIFKKNLLSKNFSIFSKIKNHNKSEDIGTAQLFQNLKKPDELKIEIEEPNKILTQKGKSKKKLKGFNRK